MTWVTAALIVLESLSFAVVTWAMTMQLRAQHASINSPSSHIAQSAKKAGTSTHLASNVSLVVMNLITVSRVLMDTTSPRAVPRVLVDMMCSQDVKNALMVWLTTVISVLKVTKLDQIPQ